MVISAEGPASSTSSQPPDPLTVGPLPFPPSGDFTFSVSKPRSKRQPLKFDSEPRQWNLRSRNGSFAFDPNERARFSVPLSDDEIAEDIYAVTGSMPRRRPKKRTRVVQKQIDV
ncbi:hypothetical protein FCM35_KLT05986 [Carex littledalei]|uniref:Uncharacterized protein n=1 Tax=Carex littledalei TaxID=544730 RepID=A0A833QV64_9POAL|nr:hypothetical protein FCM35_KLT05986 [Carex littledalei]